MLVLNILFFVLLAILLYFCCELLVKILVKTAAFLNVREFIVAFFVLAFASALPNLFLGISSALNGVPELSLGDIIGNNLVALTLAVGLGVLFSKDKEICTDSKTVRSTALFVLIATLLPLFLASDHALSRSDGIILILSFFLYAVWLFSKKERFQKIYNPEKQSEITIDKSLTQFKFFIQDIFKIIGLIVLLFIVSQGVVFSAKNITSSLGISLIFFGLIITGLTNALPEVYFAVTTAKKEENWMILGNLMGSVIFPATLVLGIIALIRPIDIIDFSSLILARFFMICAAIFFFVFVQSERKISKKEAIFLLMIYIIYIVFEIIKQV